MSSKNTFRTKINWSRVFTSLCLDQIFDVLELNTDEDGSIDFFCRKKKQEKGKVVPNNIQV